MWRGSSIGLCLAVVCCTLAQANPTYVGSLSTLDDGLVGIGGWVSDDRHPITLSWTVTQNDDSSWHYNYVFNPNGAKGALSHLILETPPNLTATEIWNATPALQPADPAWHRPRSGNPNMPEPLYGVKFEPFDDASSGTISFDSTRAPMWGDFYAKGGAKSGQLWNAGFGESGALGNHILVPDTHSGMIPAPGGLVLGSIGAGAILWLQRRRVL